MEAILKEAHLARQSRKQRLQSSFTVGEICLKYWAKVGDELGSTVWDSSLELCEFIAARSSLFVGKEVLELGAGLGLPGILSSYYAEAVHLTDKLPLLSYLRDNINSNSRDNVQAHELNWGSPNSDLQSSYDIILGADIVYADNFLPELMSSLLNYSRPDSLFILAYRPRVPAKESSFFAALEPFFALEGQEICKSCSVFMFKRLSYSRTS
mmetsp:Transcript_19203/g.35109  ORF Transcript_19203/g.35109 Transcript_19203/m.35109 type:complete len:211 (-) Transcript_19203:2029-2661(-)